MRDVLNFTKGSDQRRDITARGQETNSRALPAGRLYKVTWHRRLNPFWKIASIFECLKRDSKRARPVTTHDPDVYGKDVYLIQFHTHYPIGRGQGGFYKWMLCSEQQNTEKTSNQSENRIRSAFSRADLKVLLGYWAIYWIRFRHADGKFNTRWKMTWYPVKPTNGTLENVQNISISINKDMEKILKEKEHMFLCVKKGVITWQRLKTETKLSCDLSSASPRTRVKAQRKNETIDKNHSHHYSNHSGCIYIYIYIVAYARLTSASKRLGTQKQNSHYIILDGSDF